MELHVQAKAPRKLKQLLGLRPLGTTLPSSGMTKSCTRTGSGRPFGRNSRPPFLKSSTSSFFLVSTEIGGSLDGHHLGIDVLELIVAVGVAGPSRVLALACRLKPRRRSRRPTSFCPAVKPFSVSAADRWR